MSIQPISNDYETMKNALFPTLISGCTVDCLIGMASRNEKHHQKSIPLTVVGDKMQVAALNFPLYGDYTVLTNALC